MHGIALCADAFAAAECLAGFRAVVLCFGVGSRAAAIRKGTFVVIAFIGTAYTAAGWGVTRAGEFFGCR